MKQCKHCNNFPVCKYNYDKTKNDVCESSSDVGDYVRKPSLRFAFWIPKILIITIALLLGGCSSTTAKYKDGVAEIRRIRVLMTEDIDSFSYDATDGSFILEGYKSDMTRLLILVDKLIARDAELRRELMALGVKL